jgi:hypothetical protein
MGQSRRPNQDAMLPAGRASNRHLDSQLTDIQQERSNDGNPAKARFRARAINF